MLELDVLEKTSSVIGNYPEKRRFAFPADWHGNCENSFFILTSTIWPFFSQNKSQTLDNSEMSLKVHWTEKHNKKI